MTDTSSHKAEGLMSKLMSSKEKLFRKNLWDATSEIALLIDYVVVRE